MYYIKQTQEDINFKGRRIEVLYLELDEQGNSIREVGFDEQGATVHKFPSDYKNGKYGLFDMVPFSIEDLESDLSKEDFERIWCNS